MNRKIVKSIFDFPLNYSMRRLGEISQESMTNSHSYLAPRRPESAQRSDVHGTLLALWE